jgi:hypothetical protein
MQLTPGGASDTKPNVNRLTDAGRVVDVPRVVTVDSTGANGKDNGRGGVGESARYSDSQGP